MLSKKTERLLNDQIVKEAYASSSYLSMASWCEKEGLRGTAEFLYTQSDEEREHMMKLVRYVNEARGHAIVPGIKEPPAQYKSVSSIFNAAIEQELDVTKSIYKIVDHCLQDKDFAAFNFLQWFVAEQLEEESLFSSVLDILKMSGDDGKGLLIFDSEITKLREREAKEKKE